MFYVRDSYIILQITQRQLAVDVDTLHRYIISPVSQNVLLSVFKIIYT